MSNGAIMTGRGRWVLMLAGMVMTGVIGLVLGIAWKGRMVSGVVGLGWSASARAVAEVMEMRLFDPMLDGVAVAMVALDEDGELWYASPMAHTAMCPASALKVLTTGAALGILGPEFRFETRLASAASMAEVLDGDLVIIGGGDPALTSKQLAGMVEELAAKGLRKIDGQVRVDPSIFPEHVVSDHWNWGDIGNAYGAGAFGLNVDHNRVALRIKPGGRLGARASLLNPGEVPPDVDWQSMVTTGPRGVREAVTVYSEPYGKRMTLRGTVPADQDVVMVRAAIPNPPSAALAVVVRALEAQGIEVSGRVRHAAAPSQVLATAHSAPLMDIIRNIHMTSDNLESQCLFLMLAGDQDAAGVVRDFWETRGVEFAALRMIDGSGLARANMIRAVDLARVMHVALNHPYGEDFLESLPGYHDGMVRSKPGWMSGVTTSVGVVRRRDGKRMAYAFMANGVVDRAAALSLRDQLLAAVAGE